MRTMDKKMCLILIGLAIMMSGCSEYTPVIPERESQTAVQLLLSPDTVGVGEPSILSLEMHHIDERVFGFSLQITYDPLLVTIDEGSGFTLGEFLGTNAVALLEVEAGVIHLAATDISRNAKAMTTGSAGSIAIQGRSVGQCDFVIDINEMRFIDAQGDSLVILDLEIQNVAVSVLDQ